MRFPEGRPFVRMPNLPDRSSQSSSCGGGGGGGGSCGCDACCSGTSGGGTCDSGGRNPEPIEKALSIPVPERVKK